MISIDSKFHPCKNPIQSTIHQPLQIRTNKHRCFVFCIGHISLTCVPGIGKKNKRLLNQSGVHDLSTLYGKYRSINNIQQFKQWLQNEIGFTSYQAKMTTCGIGSKLGDIKEINTGLLPICCSSKEKHRRLSNGRNITKRNRSTEKDKEEVIRKRKTKRNQFQSLFVDLNPNQISRLIMKICFRLICFFLTKEPSNVSSEKDAELFKSESHLDHHKKVS